MSAPMEPLAQFLERTPISASMRPRFQRVMPGGETRSITYYAPYPVVIKSGCGGLITDVDGNQYDTLQEGQSVSYEIGKDERRGTPKATKVVAA